MRNTFFAATVLLLSLGPVAHASDTMIDPASAELGATATELQAKKAVKLALLNRHWELGNEKPGYIEGTYTKPKFWVKIAVTYDTKKATVKYLDSEGLDYEKTAGRQEIHPSYNKWVAGLLKEIPFQLQKELITAE